MKKILQTVFSVVIMLTALCATMLPNCAAVSNKDKVFSHLTKELGFSTAAACGIMANIEKESGFNSNYVIIDSNGRPSGGLCQWNGGRFNNLQKYCNNNGYNYLSVEGQLNYLAHELKSSYYKHIYNYLKNVSNSASGAYDAAYYWCYYFEVPANRASSAAGRGNLASSSYWPTFSKKANSLTTPAISSPSKGKSYDIGQNISFKWASSGQSTKSYTLYVTKKQDGKTKTVKKVTLSSSKRSYTLKAKSLGSGSFSAYVVASNSKATKKSSAVSFFVKCSQHLYSSSITKAPTVNATGLRTYTCKKCGKVVTKSVAKTTSAPVSLTLSAFKVESASKTKISVFWDKCENASGYEIFLFDSKAKKYKKLSSVTNSVTSFTVGSLETGKTYKIRLRAFADCAGKTVYSDAVELSAVTATKAPTLTNIERPKKQTVSLSWNKVSGADSYVLYVRQDNGKYKKAETYAANKTSCTVSGLKSGSKYYFKLRAVNKSKSNSVYSDYSNIKFAVAK